MQENRNFFLMASVSDVAQLLLVSLVAAFAFLLWYRKAFQSPVSFPKLVLSSIICSIAGVLLYILLCPVMDIANFIFLVIFLALSVPFFVTHYRQWHQAEVLGLENEYSRRGIRSWITEWNVILFYIIAFCGFPIFFRGRDWDRFLYLMVVMSVLCGITLIFVNLWKRQEPFVMEPKNDFTPALEKVLTMLHDRKVTVDEAKDLILALHKDEKAEERQRQTGMRVEESPVAT